MARALFAEVGELRVGGGAVGTSAAVMPGLGVNTLKKPRAPKTTRAINTAQGIHQSASFFSGFAASLIA